MPNGPNAAVLYACTTIGGDTSSILAELRTYARHHGIQVAAEFADRTGAAPESERPGFQAAKAAIRGGGARILITRYPAMAAYLDAERAAFDAWLHEQGASARYTRVWKRDAS